MEFRQEVLNLWVISKFIASEYDLETSVDEFVETLWEKDSFREAFLRKEGLREGREARRRFEEEVKKIIKEYEEEAKDVGF